MATVNRFEDLEIWQLARKLNKEIWLMTMREEFKHLFFLNDQIRKAAISIMNNTSEGFDRDGNKEFHHFLSIAKGSAGEVKNMLYAFSYINLITQAEFEKLLEDSDMIRNKITRLMQYLRKNDFAGYKYKKE